MVKKNNLQIIYQQQNFYLQFLASNLLTQWKENNDVKRNDV
ncbi:hypothetical protein pb186bvf_009899 [Paramecium bursaria]